MLKLLEKKIRCEVMDTFIVKINYFFYGDEKSRSSNEEFEEKQSK